MTVRGSASVHSSPRQFADNLGFLAILTLQVVSPDRFMNALLPLTRHVLEFDNRLFSTKKVYFVTQQGLSDPLLD